MARLSRHYVTALDDLPAQILSEFGQQPGLRLTFWQVRRLWDLPEVRCSAALDYLVRSRLLCLDADGQYSLPLKKDRTPWISS